MMNVLTASADASASGGGGMLLMLVYIVIIGAAMYFFAIGPRKRSRREWLPFFPLWKWETWW